MGLFDSAFATTTGSANLSPAEAVAAITLVIVASDGHLSTEEVNSVWPILSRMQLFRSYSSDVVVRMFNKLAGILSRQGIDAMLQLAKASLPFELGPTVFAIAADLALADGTVTSEEEAVLERLYQILEVPHETAIQIIQVMAIKNKG
ncbi:Tellurite resistance protein TerB [filamentous cyanobacterium CCP1]|nr:Tellurite resistance protein TerB [filamentous cyanobacterium CCP2]PSB68429.1 Tellurite resistance protein TerB [filamentous cyanobacterium CCP1]